MKNSARILPEPGRVLRRGRLSSQRRRPAGDMQTGRGPDLRRGRPAPGRLAAGAHAPRGSGYRPHRAGGGAHHRAGIRRSRRRAERRCLRAQALPDPQARQPPASIRPPDERAQGVLCRKPLHQGADLQGDAHARPVDVVLSGSSRTGLQDPPGHGPLAVLHEYLPQLGPGAAQPLHVPQRRDQHASGQRELDGRASGRGPYGFVRRFHQATVPGGGTGLFGLGHVRQRTGISAHDRAHAAGVGHDDDSGGVAEE